MDRKVPPSPLPKIWALIKKFFKWIYHIFDDYILGGLDKLYELYKKTWFYQMWTALCERFWIIHIIDRIIFWTLAISIGCLFAFWFMTLGVAVIATIGFFVIRIVSAFFLGGRIDPPLFHIIEAYGQIWSFAFRAAFELPWQGLKYIFGAR